MEDGAGLETEEAEEEGGEGSVGEGSVEGEVVVIEAADGEGLHEAEQAVEAVGEAASRGHPLDLDLP